MSENNVSSISAVIDAKSRGLQYRHSLQPQSTTSNVPVHVVRRHNSLGKNRSTNNIKKPSVPDIPEVEKSDEDSAEENRDLQKVNTPNPTDDNTRISFTKKTRKTSNISRASKTSLQSNTNNSERGFVNYGYDHSTRSSLHGSMSSLPVIREQYCCCQRWTKLEKKLAIIVAVLALTIIALVIAIGIVAGDSNSPENYHFMNFRF